MGTVSAIERKHRLQTSLVKQCIVPQNFNNLPFLYLFFLCIQVYYKQEVCFLFCIHLVRLSPENYNPKPLV